MPLRKVIADFSRGVFASKKCNQRNTFPYYQNCDSPSKHIYYEPPEEFDWDATSSLVVDTGDVVVQRRVVPGDRAYTEEEFTSAILARTSCHQPLDATEPDDELMGDAVISEGCDPKHESPVLERRNKGMLGRLRNLASRTSYSTSEDGHSHSSDYEEPDDEKRASDVRFSRESGGRNSSWAGRVRDLHRDVKKKISRLRNSRGATPDEEVAGVDGAEGSDVLMQPGSSVESIPSGSGSSLQPPTPTSSNRSSTTSAGEEDHPLLGGVPLGAGFLGRARALVDCTPSPYDRDGLAFKKGDIIDIIAKHKTGIWVGVAHGKVGHFKFINVQEISEEKKRRRHRLHNRLNGDCPRKPESLEDLLTQLGLQEYMNVLVLNGYDALDTFKELEKSDLDNLGIKEPEHIVKMLRAAEMLQDNDIDEAEMEDEESQQNQSPRDSGCYASHENLAHRDSSQGRAMANGQFVVDLEDQDTSQSESGIHSREGQDLPAINNLDASGGDSAKSTMEDLNGTAEQGEDTSGYNILPSQEDEATVDPVPAVETTPGPIVTPHLLHPGTGTKSSPGSPRKTRHKHHRNKSHSHRSKDLLSELSLNSHSVYGYARYCTEAASARGGYVHSWTAFVRNEKRHNFHDYDDVVSDPATEGEDSPGRRVYRRIKQRKGSLQTLIQDARSPSPTLIAKVNKKLTAERIYLHEEPYTDKTGFCGIPPALVQRYSEELQYGITDVADALDHIRITTLQQQNRRGVPNDFLSDSCVVPVIEPNYCSLRSWLVSLGLPMYQACLASAGLTQLHHITGLGGEELARLGVRDSYHQVYLESAIEALRMRMQRAYVSSVEHQSLS